MLKICHVIISLRNFGGAERMLVRLLLANPATAGRHTVMVLRQAGACGEKLRAAGIQVYELGMDSFLGVPRVLYRLKELIRACDPDIVQTWMYHADLLGGLAARLAGYKNVAWGIRRTALTFKDSKSTLVVMKLCALLSTRIPRRIICVAEAGRQAHVKAGYNPDAMVVIPNGFDFTNLTATPAQRLEFRRACGFAEDEIVIGCLGRFHPAKDQENFVKAAALLAPGNPKIKFMLIGLGCDAANAQLLGWLQDYRLRDRFVLLGERADVAVCLAGMDVYCMPSRTEGFPNSLGEAMAMGLPCVATNVGDTELLAGDTVALVPREDSDALARALLDLINGSEAARKELGRRAKQRVTAEFSIERTCGHFEEVYREMAAEV